MRQVNNAGHQDQVLMNEASIFSVSWHRVNRNSHLGAEPQIGVADSKGGLNTPARRCSIKRTNTLTGTVFFT